MKTLVDILHILLCKNPHIYDMMLLMDRDETSCYYYLENDISECETLPDHIKWLEISEQFKTHLNLSSDEEAVEFVKQAIELGKQLRELSGENSDRMNFILELMR